jgi:hypothetical protein
MIMSKSNSNPIWGIITIIEICAVNMTNLEKHELLRKVTNSFTRTRAQSSLILIAMYLEGKISHDIFDEVEDEIWKNSPGQNSYIPI